MFVFFLEQLVILISTYFIFHIFYLILQYYIQPVIDTFSIKVSFTIIIYYYLRVSYVYVIFVIACGKRLKLICVGEFYKLIYYLLLLFPSWIYKRIWLNSTTLCDCSWPWSRLLLFMIAWLLCYWMSVSQMTKDMFRLSKSNPVLSSFMNFITRVTRRVSLVEQ
jgi:hypothetical protein